MFPHQPLMMKRDRTVLETPFPFTSGGNWTAGIWKTHKEFLQIYLWSRAFAQPLTLPLVMCAGCFRIYVRLTSGTGRNLCYLFIAFDLTYASIDPNVSNISLNTVRWQFIGLHSQSRAQETNSINVIKDLRVSTGAVQMLLCSHIADKWAAPTPIVLFL